MRPAFRISMSAVAHKQSAIKDTVVNGFIYLRPAFRISMSAVAHKQSAIKDTVVNGFIYLRITPPSRGGNHMIGIGVNLVKVKGAERIQKVAVGRFTIPKVVHTLLHIIGYKRHHVTPG